MACAIALAVVLVMTGPAAEEPGDSESGANGPIQVAPAPQIPRLTNETWQGVRDAIEALQAHLDRQNPPDLADGTGGQFIHQQAYAKFDLARGWVSAAPYSAAIAFDILQRGRVEDEGLSLDELRAENERNATALQRRLAAASTSLCDAQGGLLLLQAAEDAAASQRLAEASPEQALRQEAFRWAKQHVASAFIGRPCEPADAGDTAYAGRLIERARTELAQRREQIPARVADTFDRLVAERAWAGDNGLTALRDLLTLHAGAYAVLVLSDAEARPAPSLDEVAAMAEAAFADGPTGLRAWSYGYGTRAYEFAAHADDPEEDASSPRAFHAWRAYAAFLLSLEDPAARAPSWLG